MEIILSSLGGIVPAVIWLWFWLKEDAKNPEPKRFVAYSFIAGMLSALLVIPFESFVIITLPIGFLSVVLLASIEEIFKFIAAFFSALRKSYNDEPIDAVIYMITVALGFAAAENSLYLWQSFNNGLLLEGIIMTNMRFIGATVLHTISSGVIGIMMALSFYKNKITKTIYLLIGVILSIALHTDFNFSIINNSEGNVFSTFVFIWMIVMVVLLFVEKIKRLKKPKMQTLN